MGQHTTPPARIHLLPAKEAPLAVILRRKPSKLFHVMTWNTETDAIEHGSWFRGRLYPLEADVSFDGQWMVYFALGANGMDSWTGICRLPMLKTVWDAKSIIDGGGYWRGRNELYLNCRTDDVGSLLQLGIRAEAWNLGYSGIFELRLKRAGWRLLGPMLPVTLQPNSTVSVIPSVSDRHWYCRPTARHPLLRMCYRGSMSGQKEFDFSLDGFPSVVSADTDWATWDSLGQLLLARAGTVERWTLEDLEHGTPTTKIDFEGLTPGIREPGGRLST